jgi:glycosyltransferase involved in cell wall biosynthesis
MKPAIGVITCTHNPRQDYLEKVLAALKSQTLPLEQWEYLLIDNASDRQLSSEIDLTWHPNARHLRENKLGLTPARLRGIQESQADILVFVDDDNILDSDYLEVALQIGKDWSILGAWGGQIRGGFERIPPDWTKPYWVYLGIREFDRDKWSNLLHQHETTPCGVGLCVRKIVAEKYTELITNDPKRLALDRKGTIVTSCGDTDLAFTACDIGLGTGQFKALKSTHLMPPNRLEERYLLKLYEGIYYSHLILDSFRNKMPVRMSWLGRLSDYQRMLRMPPRKRRFYQARKRGIALAIQEIYNSKTTQLQVNTV